MTTDPTKPGREDEAASLSQRVAAEFRRQNDEIVRLRQAAQDAQAKLAEALRLMSHCTLTAEARAFLARPEQEPEPPREQSPHWPGWKPVLPPLPGAPEEKKG